MPHSNPNKLRIWNSGIHDMGCSSVGRSKYNVVDRPASFFFVVWGLLGRKLLYHCGLKDILLRRSLLCYTAHSILTHNESEDILRGCSSYLKGLLKPSHDCSADGRLYLRTRRAAPPFCVYDRSAIHRSQSGPSYIFMFVLREQ